MWHDDPRPPRPPKPRSRFAFHMKSSWVTPIVCLGKGAASVSSSRAAAEVPAPAPMMGRTPANGNPAGNTTRLPLPSIRASSRSNVQLDELGKLVAENTCLLQSLGLRGLIDKLRGRGDLKVTQEVIDSHPAGSLLQQLQTKGAPAIMSTPPWSDEEINERVKRGSHKSCLSELQFLREEMLEFSKKGFWLLVPYPEVQRLRHLGQLPDLRVSPMGVVPQRDRRPRLINDLTFYGINANTVPLAPKESMQFGRALERILYKIRHSNPRFGPVLMGKVDLADGFYRVWLNHSAVPRLAVALPKFPEDEHQLIAFPLVLPMGWAESPPYFSAVTETIADLVNNNRGPRVLPPHPLEDLACTPPQEVPPVEASAATQQILSTAHPVPHPGLRPLPAPVQPTPCPSSAPKVLQWAAAPPVLRPLQAPVQHTDIPSSAPKVLRWAAAPPVLRPLQAPVQHTDIFVDDFIQLSQGNHQVGRKHIRSLLHAIDRVFRPVDALDTPMRKHVPSVKKLKKGDAFMCTRKVILGWLVDSMAQTIELPEHRKVRLRELFHSLRGKTRVALKTWHRVLGELRSMSLGIPGSQGLFSLLQEALLHVDKDRIRITTAMRDMLTTFEHLADSVVSRPTELAELVPDHPIAIGPHDASAAGMGGVWLPATTNSNVTPILWRAPFPQHIQDRLVSWTNPQGDITNSDLELAGLVAHQDILAQEVNCHGCTQVPLGDNITMVSGHHKKSVTTTGPRAYLLLLNSAHQQHYRYVSKSDYLPGSSNVMADDCSRLLHLTDSQLLSHFNATYPQEVPWRLVHLRSEMLSSVISALQMTQPNLASLLNAPPTRTAIGNYGKPSYPLSQVWTPTSNPSHEASSYLYSRFSRREYGKDESRPAVVLSELNAYRTTYGPLPRKSVWGPQTALTQGWMPTTPCIST